MAKAPGQFIISGMEFAGLWDYKSSYQIFVLFFLFLGVSNARDIGVKTLFKVIAYSGLAMAILMLFQRLGMDQIFEVLPPDIVKGTNLPEMGGSLGQATLSAPFIVMCLPFMNYLKKWWLSLLMLSVVLLSGSSFAILGLAVVLAVPVVLHLTVDLPGEAGLNGKVRSTRAIRNGLRNHTGKSWHQRRKPPTCLPSEPWKRRGQ